MARHTSISFFNSSVFVPQIKATVFLLPLHITEPFNICVFFKAQLLIFPIQMHEQTKIKKTCSFREN